MLRIQSVEIENIRRIRSLKLEFTERCSIICGTNGIGKTTLLDTIAASLTLGGGYYPLERSSDSQFGTVSTRVLHNGAIFLQGFSSQDMIGDIRISQKAPGAHDSSRVLSNDTIMIRGVRDIAYERLNALSSDQIYETRDNARLLHTGLVFRSVKSWFSRRLGFETHLSSTPHLLNDLKLAKDVFARLDPQVSYHNFNPQTFDVMVNTDRGVIPFEYLSGGFKAVYLMVLGIIQAIEERNQDQPVDALEFDGAVLVDELDTQLHPRWQQRVFGILKDTFPKAQFIVTTHSPFVVQAADPNEVIALEEDGESGTLRRREIVAGKHGFRGWTIEEILTDVMGLETTITNELTEAKHAFSKAIDNDDQIAATKAYRVLLELLHPESDLRELLRAQLASVGGASDAVTEAL